RHACRGHFRCFVIRTNCQLDVDADLLGDVQHDIGSRIFLEALCSHGNVVASAGQTGDHVSAVSVCSGRSSQTAGGVGNHNLGANDGGAGLVGDGAADVAGVLGVRGEGEGQRNT